MKDRDNGKLTTNQYYWRLSAQQAKIKREAWRKMMKDEGNEKLMNTPKNHQRMNNRQEAKIKQETWRKMMKDEGNEKLMNTPRNHRRVNVPKAKIRTPAWRKWFLSVGLGVVISPILLGAGVWHLSMSLPFSDFEETRQALNQAHQVEANQYAPELLRESESRWEQARLAWQNENEKWFLLRNFRLAQGLAESATRQAQNAAARAVVARDSTQVSTAANIASVRQKVNGFKEQFSGIPIAKAVYQKFVRGEMLLLESERAFERNDYSKAAEKIQAALSHIDTADTYTTQTMQAYFANIPKWQRWVAETIAGSAQRKAAAIIVDKMGGRCQVYVAGRLKAEYSVEFGPHWIGPKKRGGDGATPEGRYYVTNKKGPGGTRYYKALDINYPNEDDVREFREAKRKGELPRRAYIGGLIEIHGTGGRGANWTSGCVALRNRDMDAVFALAGVGTPVTIVGTLESESPLGQASIDSSKKGL